MMLRLRVHFISTLMLSLTSFCYGEETVSVSREGDIQLVSDECLFAAPGDAGDPLDGLDEEPLIESPREFRLLQQVGTTATWLAKGGDDGLGMTEVNASATFIVPLMIRGAPLMVTPSFGVTFLDSPTGIDLPNELYRASANIMWMKKPSEKLSYMFGISPGVSSDFEATENAFRLFGFGAVTYQYTEQVQFTLGAAYTGRNDIPVFPMAGVIWTPYEDLRVEIAAPRPRIAHRVYGLPWSLTGTEDWIYFAGELGGGTWAVERPSGLEDELTIRDFRLVVGYERKTKGGRQSRIEAGYVLGREIEFEDEPTNFEPFDTFMIRAGGSF